MSTKSFNMSAVKLIAAKNIVAVRESLPLTGFSRLNALLWQLEAAEEPLELRKTGGWYPCAEKVIPHLETLEMLEEAAKEAQETLLPQLPANQRAYFLALLA